MILKVRDEQDFNLTMKQNITARRVSLSYS